MSEKKVRVLVVDDSSVIRTLLSSLLSSDPEIEVVATAPDPYVAREKLVELKPDVITLDIEMPRMDGLTFLEKVMTHLPTRTIVISSLTIERSETLLKALELGAVDVVAKPVLNIQESLKEMGADLITRVKVAAKARITPRAAQESVAKSTAQTGGTGQQKLSKTTHQILAFASSTGGTEALKVVLKQLPKDIPGTVIVQHMPPVFTKSYAEHLARILPFDVREASDGDHVVPGRVLLAPGNFHMVVTRVGGNYVVRLNQEPQLHGVRPAADYLLQSVAAEVGSNAVGCVLTGMGKDGAKGLLAMRDAGAFTIAQDEATSVVYGMPRVAAELNAAHIIAPLDRIAEYISSHFRRRHAS